MHFYRNVLSILSDAWLTASSLPATHYAMEKMPLKRPKNVQKKTKGANPVEKNPITHFTDYPPTHFDQYATSTARKHAITNVPVIPPEKMK